MIICGCEHEHVTLHRFYLYQFPQLRMVELLTYELLVLLTFFSKSFFAVFYVTRGGPYICFFFAS